MTWRGLERGLELCQVHDATTHDWNLEIKLPMLWVDLIPSVQMSAETRFVGGDQVEKDFLDNVFLTADGKRIRFDTTFLSAWNDGRLPRELDKLHVLTDPRKDARVRVVDASGAVSWRPAENLRISYTVTRHAYLGHLTPDECRGIMHADGRFDLSFINAANLDLTRDPAWPEVDPDNLPVQLGTTVLTSESWQLVGGTLATTDTEIALMEGDGS